MSWSTATAKRIPPAVYYVEHASDDGTISTCKYSILSLFEFEKRCSSRAFLSQVWGRFSQPCAVLWAKNDQVLERVWAARVIAIETMARATAPLLDGKATASELWGRGFYESYRTELRPESSTGRSEEIVTRFADRYKAISASLYGYPNAEGQFSLPTAGKSRAKRNWMFRRILGKPAAALRVLLGAATFDGGVDYIARKVENHSGVKLNPTPAQRKHPVLHSPVLFWKIWRQGAFK